MSEQKSLENRALRESNNKKSKYDQPNKLYQIRLDMSSK